MKGLKGLRVCRTAYLAHRIPVWFRCGAVPNGPRETGARKLRPGWCKGPVGTEGGKPRPDYGLPNLTPRTLNVVNVLGRVFKPYPDAGSHVLRQEPGGEDAEGTRLGDSRADVRRRGEVRVETVTQPV
jgi:hypothetical protein